MSEPNKEELIPLQLVKMPDNVPPELIPEVNKMMSKMEEHVIKRKRNLMIGKLKILKSGHQWAGGSLVEYIWRGKKHLMQLLL